MDTHDAGCLQGCPLMRPISVIKEHTVINKLKRSNAPPYYRAWYGIISRWLTFSPTLLLSSNSRRTKLRVSSVFTDELENKSALTGHLCWWWGGGFVLTQFFGSRPSSTDLIAPLPPPLLIWLMNHHHLAHQPSPFVWFRSEFQVLIKIPGVS